MLHCLGNLHDVIIKQILLTLSGNAPNAPKAAPPRNLKPNEKPSIDSKPDLKQKEFQPKRILSRKIDFEPMFQIRQSMAQEKDIKVAETKDGNAVTEVLQSKKIEDGANVTQDKDEDMKKEQNKSGGEKSKNKDSNAKGAIPKKDKRSEEDESPNKTSVFPETLPKELAEMKHPLSSGWSLWYFINDRTKQWEDCLVNVYTVRTVEDFWYE